MPEPDTIKIDCDNLLSKRGAKLLAEAIMNFWAGRGHLVFAEGYPLPDSDVWGVRSNMINGLPPKHLGLRS